MSDEALQAAGTVLAYRFLARQQPVDDLSLLSEALLKSQELLLAAREELKTWAAKKGLEATSEGTISDVLAELDAQPAVEALAQPLQIAPNA